MTAAGCRAGTESTVLPVSTLFGAALVLALTVVGCASAPASHPPAASGPAQPTLAAEVDEVDGPTAPPSESRDEPQSIIGVASCDEYLALYEKCEARLQPEIAAGARRTYQAERVGLEFMKAQSAGAELEAGCESLLSQLEKDCD